MSTAEMKQELIETETESLTLAQDLRALKIVDQPSYEGAVGFWRRAKEWLKSTKEDEDNPRGFASPRAKAWATYQAILTQQKAVCGPVETAIEVAGQEITRWTQEQRRIEEQHRREAEIEQQRIAEMERQSRAVDAIDSGADEESVEAILQEPIVPTPVKVEPTYQKSEAISTVDNFKARIKDLKKFVKYVAKEVDKNPGVLPLLLGIKSIDGGFESPGLNKMAKAQQGLLAIPGVEVYNDAFVKSAGRR